MSHFKFIFSFLFFVIFSAADTASALENDALESVNAPLSEAIFRPDSVVTVYLWNDTPKIETLTLTLLGGTQERRDYLTLRVFDPQESYLLRRLIERPGDGSLSVLGSTEESKIDSGEVHPPFDLKSPTWNRSLQSYSVSLEEPGLHAVRMVSGLKNTALQLENGAISEWGVSFQNGRFSAWREKLSKAWFYVPEHALTLDIAGTGITLRDENGNIVYPLKNSSAGTAALIPIERPGAVWQIDFHADSEWTFSAAGFSIILTENPEAAKRFAQVTLKTPQGSYVNHNFQVKLEAIISDWLSAHDTGNTEELLARLDAIPECVWMEQDPKMALAMRQRYGLLPSIRFALAEQNLDPDSHWSGVIGNNVWTQRIDASEPENRWDYLRSIPGHRGEGKGGINESPAATPLAYAYRLKHPLNPYYNDKAVLHRAVAGALRDMMAITEDEIIPGSGSDRNTYPGIPAFVFGKRYFPEFGMLAPHVPAEVRAPWTEGMRRLFDRYWAEGLVSTRNQSAHYLTAFQWFAIGTGDPDDAALAKAYARRYVEGASSAGYHEEATGPCSTYAGMQHFFMGQYYALSGDPLMLEAIRQSYNFYNHTVAPEANGSAYGGFNYSHRTPDGFHAEQFFGARNWLKHVLPEVALWQTSPTPAQEAIERQKLRSNLQQPLPEPIISLTALLPEDLSKIDNSISAFEIDELIWPAESQASFTRMFGDELIAIRRPAYYTAIYVGKPAKGAFYLGQGADGLLPPENYEEHTGGDLWNLYYKQKGTMRPFNNGGMTTFWTPAYGNAILAGKTAYTHHGLVAQTESGVRHAEAYFSTDAQLDKEQNQLVVSGRLDSLPLTYTRTYTFEDDMVHVDLQLRGRSDFSVDSFVENIPLAMGSFKPSGSELFVQGEPIPMSLDAFPPETHSALKLKKYATAAFGLKDSKGNGLQVELDQIHPVVFCLSGPRGREGIQYNRAEIHLPTVWRDGDTVSLKYILRPILKD